MKIVLSVHHFPPHRVARWLIAHGHAVQVVCVEAIDEAAPNGSLTWSDEVYEDILVRRLSFKLAAAPDPLRWSFDNPLLEAHFADLLAANPPDVLHLVSGYLLGIAPLRAARQMGIRTVVTLTDFWFLCPTLQFLRGDGSLCVGPEPIECVRCLHDRQRRFRMLDQRAPALGRGFWQLVQCYPPLSDLLRAAAATPNVSGATALVARVFGTPLM